MNRKQIAILALGIVLTLWAVINIAGCVILAAGLEWDASESLLGVARGVAGRMTVAYSFIDAAYVIGMGMLYYLWCKVSRR